MTRAGEVVVAYLATQRDVLADKHDEVRTDAPDAVHRSRVATRRARSALRTYKRLFDARAVRRLRDELAWHADLLGAPRDAEVLRDRLAAALDTLPSDRVHGPVRGRLTEDLEDTHRLAHARLVESMDTQRYRALRARLDRFVADPPSRAKAGKTARHALPRLLGAAVARVADLARRAEDLPSDLTHWHEVRKAAKAARYCSEALVAEFGEPAQRLVSAWEAVTEAFGAVQDSVVAEQVLVRLAAGALLAGEPTDTYLTLEARELAVRDEALARGRDALGTALRLRVSTLAD